MPAMCAMEARKADHKIMSSISSANILEKNWKKKTFSGFEGICMDLHIFGSSHRTVQIYFDRLIQYDSLAAW
jgi:hypothetical protein